MKKNIIALLTLIAILFVAVVVVLISVLYHKDVAMPSPSHREPELIIIPNDSPINPNWYIHSTPDTVITNCNIYTLEQFPTKLSKLPEDVRIRYMESQIETEGRIFMTLCTKDDTFEVSNLTSYYDFENFSEYVYTINGVNKVCVISDDTMYVYDKAYEPN